MTFTRKDLAEAIPHLVFDFFHFRFYSRHLRDGGLARCSPAVQQAVLYSLLLHFRVLWDFFYKTAGNDDCTIGRFRVLEGVAAIFPSKIEMPAGAEVLSKNLNKRLAHMTATRWRESQPRMSFYQRYFDDIEEHMATFEKALPTDLQDSFAKTMRSFERRYGERL